MKRSKRLFFRLLGLALVIGVIVLGYYQMQWISTAALVEEDRILKEMHRSADRALDEAYDEIRVLTSFSYVSPENISEQTWEEVYSSIEFWRDQSDFPDLLRNVFVVPAAEGAPYLAFDEERRGFIEVEAPSDFRVYNQYLKTGGAADAYRRIYAPLLPKGYFILPLHRPAPDPGAANGDPARVVSGYLAIQVDTELLFAEVLPRYLDVHLDGFNYRIVRREEVFSSTAGAPEISRPPDAVIPVFGGPFLRGNGIHAGESNSNHNRATEDAMSNPVARLWFLQTSAFPNINLEHFSSQEIRLSIPMLEIYHPDRSLQSTMRLRMLSSLLLSIGTLSVLLAAYFVLYILLSKTDRQRSRERDFVTSMSHELRTPLSVITATSDNLLRGIVGGPERVKQYGEVIQTQARRLGKMVESILFYSGMESMNTGSKHTEQMHLRHFFEEIIRHLEPAAEEKGARIVLSIETQIDSVESEPDALRIISENLMVNGLHHGVTGEEQQGAEVRVLVRTRPPRFLYLIVEDDGPGIPPEEMKRLFEPFVRGERSKRDQVPGSGLGLHIVHRVSSKLGGQISVESPYEDMAGISRHGVRVTVRVPVRMERRGDT